MQPLGKTWGVLTKLEITLLWLIYTTPGHITEEIYAPIQRHLSIHIHHYYPLIKQGIGVSLDAHQLVDRKV